MTEEKAFRPTTLEEFAGQKQAKLLLSISIQAAKKKNQVLDHVLISGPRGTGKTTTAGIIANELGKPLKVFAGPSIKKIEEITDILCAIEEGDCIFIDEIHSLSRKIQEVLYFAMEQYVVDVNVDGFQERVSIPHFTLIGATTSLGGLEQPCRDRFQIQVALTAYGKDDIAEIVKKSFKVLGKDIDHECAALVGRCARGVPRVANSFIRRIDDFSTVLSDGKITKEVVLQTLEVLDVNIFGLNKIDRDYLEWLSRSNKPIGVDTLASALGTDKTSIENTVEPFLLQQHYVLKTARGRIITDEGRKALKGEE